MSSLAFDQLALSAPCSRLSFKLQALRSLHVQGKFIVRLLTYSIVQPEDTLVATVATLMEIQFLVISALSASFLYLLKQCSCCSLQARRIHGPTKRTLTRTVHVQLHHGSHHTMGLVFWRSYSILDCPEGPVMLE